MLTGGGRVRKKVRTAIAGAGGICGSGEKDQTDVRAGAESLSRGIGERLHFDRFVLGCVDRTLAEANFVAGSGKSTASLVLVVSGSDET